MYCVTQTTKFSHLLILSLITYAKLHLLVMLHQRNLFDVIQKVIEEIETNVAIPALCVILKNARYLLYDLLDYAE